MYRASFRISVGSILALDPSPSSTLPVDEVVALDVLVDASFSVARYDAGKYLPLFHKLRSSLILMKCRGYFSAL